MWGADSEQFDPERWLDPSRLPPRDKTTFGFCGTNTFIEGPRMCIGYRLGMFLIRCDYLDAGSLSCRLSDLRIQGRAGGPH